MALINVVAGFDANFAQHACVMLRSLLDSNSDHYFRLYLLVPANFTQRRPLMSLQETGRTQVMMVPVPPKYVLGVRVSPAITKAAYYRLLAGELLPTDVDRVVYLDSDMIVRGDIRSLWETDLQGFALAAVREANKNPLYKKILGLSDDTVYFNSGVLLMDLDRWRRENLGPKVIEFSIRHPNTLTHDQCALNGFFNGQYLLLEDRWNVQSDMLEDTDTLQEFQKHGLIIHFTCSWNKPWYDAKNHPFAPLYLRTCEEHLTSPLGLSPCGGAECYGDELFGLLSLYAT